MVGISADERIWHTRQLSPGVWSPASPGPPAPAGTAATVVYSDVRGYQYDETSDYWKGLCSALPCFALLTWPGYKTTIVEDMIDGEPVVIQLWKGRCQYLFARPDVPGGVGAEVGVYRRNQARALPGSIPFLPGPVAAAYLAAVGLLGGNSLWWPAPDLHTTLEYQLINPNTGEVFYSAGAESTFWLAKWMTDASYNRYTADHGGNVPPVDGYVLEYRIDGKSYPRW